MKAIEFYKDVFGANVRRIFFGPISKTVGHAELEIRDSKLMLSDEFPAMNVLSPQSPGGCTSTSIFMYVEDADEIFNNAVNGATVMMPLMDTFWGDRAGIHSVTCGC